MLSNDWSLLVPLDEEKRQRNRSRSRFAFYRYLQAVYRLYRKLEKGNCTHEFVRNLQRTSEWASHDRAHPLRVLIDNTYRCDEKTRSRWTQALRYAFHRRVRPRALLSFLRRNGGAAGSARKFAELSRRQRSLKWKRIRMKHPIRKSQSLERPMPPCAAERQVFDQRERGQSRLPLAFLKKRSCA